MLNVNGIHKSFADAVVLSGVSFIVNPGERVGLIGPNGCGKSTLLKIIAGELKPDRGSVQLASGARVACLSQGLAAPEGATIDSLVAGVLGDPSAAEADVARLAQALAHAPQDAQVQRAYEAALEQLQRAADARDEGRAAGVLAHLGLGALPRDTPARQLSGGQKTRLGLALALLSDPNVLLLDEPTNHLDLEMVLWLEERLMEFDGAALIVSHDRSLLDAAITTTLELDAAAHTLRAYPGNYTDYLQAKRAEIEHQQQMYHTQREQITQLQGAALHLRGIAKFRKGGKADSGDKFAKGFFANRGKGTVAKAKAIERRIQHLREQAVDKPRTAWQMRMAFDGAEASGRDVAVLTDLAAGYAPDAPVLRDVNLTLRFGERVTLIGANGSGKTTLARTIAGLLPPLTGEARLGANVRLGYFAQEQEVLDARANALDTVLPVMKRSETEVRWFLHRFLFEGDDVFTPVAQLSFGERARLALAVLVARGCNFLLLDEPINHLDIPSREQFEHALGAFEGTSLVVAHDLYFIARYATRVWKAAHGTVRAYVDVEQALRG